jgi:hypothetical protein
MKETVIQAQMSRRKTIIQAYFVEDSLQVFDVVNLHFDHLQPQWLMFNF